MRAFALTMALMCGGVAASEMCDGQPVADQASSRIPPKTFTGKTFNIDGPFPASVIWKYALEKTWKPNKMIIMMTWSAIFLPSSQPFLYAAISRGMV